MTTTAAKSRRDIENALALQCVTTLTGIIRPEVLRAIFPDANSCVLKHVCASVNACITTKTTTHKK
jgi:hypothetical protein